MESEATITNDSAPVDSAPDSGADIGSTMEQVYDAHHESDDTQSATDIGSNEWNADHTVTDQTPEQTYSPSDQLGVQMPLAWGKSQEALSGTASRRMHSDISQTVNCKRRGGFQSWGISRNMVMSVRHLKATKLRALCRLAKMASP